MTDERHWQTAVVTGIRTLTPRVKSFTFRLPRPAPFIAGQHADIRLTADDDYTAMRSYSVASAPDDPGRIELAIEKLDDGEVSPFFHDVVQVGDEIELRFPLGGHFIWRPSDGGPLLLVGAGSGVVPLVAMIRHRSVAAPDLAAVLVASSRTWADLPFRDELLALHREGNGFEMRLALTRDDTPIDGVAIARYRINSDLIRAALEGLPATPRHVFICGSSRFVDIAADALVRVGIAAASIRTERYGT